MSFPILWRYTLQSFLRIFFLSVFCFLAVLLVSRFKDIARFTALSSDWLKTGLFLVYQLPLILPIAIPISALIGSFLFMRSFSGSHELTALRAAGMRLATPLTPLLLASCLLSLFNFSICAEIAPYCRRETRTLLYKETSENPLLLLQRQQLVKIKHAYLNMGIEEDQKAKDFLLVAHNDTNERLSLITARELRIEGSQLLGRDVAMISHLKSEREEAFDPLIIENQTSMSTSAPTLSTALKKNRPRLEANSLNFKMLLLRIQDEMKKSNAAQVELLRRITLSWAVFSLTFLGCTYGIQQGRTESKSNLFKALFLTLLVLLSYLLGKGLKNNFPLAVAAFLFPHLLIWSLSIRKIHRLSRGLV